VPAEIKIPNLDDLIQRYLAGEPIFKLTKEFGINGSTLASHFRKAGVQLRSRSESCKLGGAALVKTIANLADLIKRYEAGESVNSIAATCDISHTALSAKLREAGVVMRDRAEGLLLANTEPPIANISEIAKRYRRGEHIKPLAEEFGVGVCVLERQLKEAGVEIRSFTDAILLSRRKKLSVKTKEEIVRLYRSGVSRRELAERFGFFAGSAQGRSGRPTGLYRILAEAGVPIRDSCESNAAWYASNSSERVRQRQYAAWIAGAKRRERDLLNVSPAEPILVGALEALGVRVVQQLAVDIYNLDIAIEELPIAIEVEGGTEFAPSQRTLSKARLEYLLNQHWAVLWVVHHGLGLKAGDIRAVTDKILALLDLARRDESVFGKYGVINRQGKTLTGSRYKLSTRPRIPGF